MRESVTKSMHSGRLEAILTFTVYTVPIAGTFDPSPSFLVSHLFSILTAAFSLTGGTNGVQVEGPSADYHRDGRRLRHHALYATIVSFGSCHRDSTTLLRRSSSVASVR